MSALGWELNLGFAASDSGSVVVAAASPFSTLLLLGACLTMLVTILG